MTAATSLMHEAGRLRHWRHSRPHRCKRRKRDRVSKRFFAGLALIADALSDLDPPPPLTT